MKSGDQNQQIQCGLLFFLGWLGFFAWLLAGWFATGLVVGFALALASLIFDLRFFARPCAVLDSPSHW